MSKTHGSHQRCSLFGKKSLSIKSLATSRSHMFDMAMRKSKWIERRRRGSFCLKAMASFLVSWLYVLVWIAWNWCLWCSGLYRCWRSKPLVYILHNKKSKERIRRCLRFLWRYAYLCPRQFSRWSMWEDSEKEKIVKIWSHFVLLERCHSEFCVLRPRVSTFWKSPREKQYSMKI